VSNRDLLAVNLKAIFSASSKLSSKIHEAKDFSTPKERDVIGRKTMNLCPPFEGAERCCLGADQVEFRPSNGAGGIWIATAINIPLLWEWDAQTTMQYIVECGKLRLRQDRF